MTRARQRILSGMRPTGRLHLGHLVGALDNWVRLQEENDCFYCVVDWHALTTNYESTGEIRGAVIDNTMDWLAAGIDPERSVVFVQSRVLEHAELHLLLSMITPLGWLERVPTYKEQMSEISGRDLHTYGFLGYPTLQAADVLIYKANAVPVGEDQAPHIELTREIARRFNHLYGRVFPEPATLLTEVPRLPGTDGRKMSKSYNNTIALTEKPEVMKETIRGMVTDPARVRRTDPGNPDVCPVGDYHKVFSTAERMAEVDRGCRTAGIGCIQCKGWLFESIQQRTAPIYERRKAIEARPDAVRDILAAGADKARAVAAETMGEVREAMKI
ncbi:MAG TPA: tryptophan--tRNA ligase [Terriglobia bacterium]|nr:tryptophan--tRNA ligase [Terriglobia bacterium]